MKFLEEIVEVVLSQHAGVTDDLTIVFPNRRAGLFFQKYLATRITKPIWSPKIENIEDFIKALSGFKSADKLELIFELYTVFIKLNKSREDFDKFFYWGNVMLQDFDELDKFLVDPGLLFKNLVHVKNLENNVDYLLEDQKKLIGEFWRSFGEKLSSHQQGFLRIWDNLHQTYLQFKSRLSEKGIAYDGMIYREVAEGLQKEQLKPDFGKVIFAGFNVLSKSEESIISWFVKEGKGEAYWDADDYYLKDNKKEAGRFLRQMKFGNTILERSFRKTYGNAFEGSRKKIEVISVASDVGQAQQVSALLRSWHTDFDESTAIVLPNNELLFPVLHALPKEVETLNVTMGYPLSLTPVNSFLDALIDLQMNAEKKRVFHFRSVLTILRHPLLMKNKDELIVEIARAIIQKNIIWVPMKMLETEHDLLRLVFRKTPANELSDYLIDSIRYLAGQHEDGLEKEFFFRFYTLLNRLNGFIQSNNLQISTRAYQKLFRQLVQSERMPFEGEPLLGLQVMGILETRNLDFENVIILSMNESLIPPAAKNVSFIPYSLRKVFELPVIDHQDAIYAYIFYRLVQGAKNIYFIYNSTENSGKSGEVSRFVRQLEYETDIDISYKTISEDVTIEGPNVISVIKNESTLQNLFRFTSKHNFQKRFTPTALNTYLDCRLKFYFRYVLELYEQQEISEEADPIVFGNILHHVMEQLYLPFDADGKRTVYHDDIALLKKRTDVVIRKEFAKQFGTEEDRFQFEGQNILAREIIKKMVLRVLEFDKLRTPFDILGVEADDEKGFVLNAKIDVEGSTVQVGMKGIIDRIECKDDVVRIVDYKTGKDDKSFSDIPSLFDKENTSRNKAVFQIFFYGLLYLGSPIGHLSSPIEASLFNMRELFNEDFSPLIQKKNGRFKENIFDIRAYLDDFKTELNNLLGEIFDKKIAFTQTDDHRKCSYCPYSGLCNR